MPTLLVGDPPKLGRICNGALIQAFGKLILLNQNNTKNTMKITDANDPTAPGIHCVVFDEKLFYIQNMTLHAYAAGIRTRAPIRAHPSPSWLPGTRPGFRGPIRAEGDQPGLVESPLQR